MTNLLSKVGGWFTDEMAKVYALPRQRTQGLLLGCPLWGNKYVDRFRAYCLPSIMSPKNLEALQGSRLVFFTDRASFVRLWKALRGVEQSGLDVQILTIPQDIMDLVPVKASENKYWIIGIFHNLTMQMAGRDGMAFHMLMPDHLYSHEYFARLLAIGKHREGIAQTNISANIGTLAAELEAHRTPDGLLSIPDRILGDLAWRNLHQRTRATLMTNAKIPDAMPNIFKLTWQGRDSLTVHSCHMNVAYLSADLCAAAQPVIPATMDAELPSFMPKDFYVPSVSDGLTHIELSDDTNGEHETKVSFKQFAMSCWASVLFRAEQYMPYFNTPCVVPIEAQETFQTGQEIREQQAAISRMLMDALPEMAVQYAQTIVFKGLSERIHGRTTP